MPLQTLKRFWQSPYELKPRGSLSQLAEGKTRAGALLQLEFKDVGTGYADLFPWTELGDAPLAEQLAYLGRGELTPLLINSLEFGRIDAEARARGRSLWASAEIPLSHYLILDAENPDASRLESAKAEGFDHFKAKLPRDPERATRMVEKLSSLLGPSCRLRLDFNSQLTVDSYFEFVARMSASSTEFSIDYIEDPTPWTAERGFGIPETPFTPAVDREASLAISPQNSGGYCPPVMIIKPALQDWKYCVRRAKEVGIRPIFSSYLDHPVGQAFAAWAASHSSPHEVCGLLSHLAYEPNEFSERLSQSGPRFVPPASGTGIGFDDLLAKRDWRHG